VCDAYLCGKAHQFPYPQSSSRSSAPLELIFSYVWGPTVDSFGHKQYYVSFIDDYSKLTWLYLLHRKSEVFQFFKEFQCLVEHMFDKKILSMKTDWGGEYECLNSFFLLNWHCSPSILSSLPPAKWCGREKASEHHRDGHLSSSKCIHSP
jgi:hypothetical protein